MSYLRAAVHLTLILSFAAASRSFKVAEENGDKFTRFLHTGIPKAWNTGTSDSLQSERSIVKESTIKGRVQGVLFDRITTDNSVVRKLGYWARGKDSLWRPGAKLHWKDAWNMGILQFIEDQSRYTWGYLDIIWRPTKKDSANGEAGVDRVNADGMYSFRKVSVSGTRLKKGKGWRRKLLFSSKGGVRNARARGHITWVGKLDVILGPDVHNLKQGKSHQDLSHEGEWEGEALGLVEKRKAIGSSKLEGEWEGDDFLAVAEDEYGVDEGEERDDDDEDEKRTA